MVKIFTNEHRQWLRQYAKEYNRRVLGLVPDESGQQYAKARAEEFVNRWTDLVDGNMLTRDVIIEKVVTWFRNSNHSRRQQHLIPPNMLLSAISTNERRSALEEQTQEEDSEENRRPAEELQAANKGVIANRQILKSSLQHILKAYSIKTDASFYVLMATPENEANGSALVSQLEHCSIPNFPSFHEFRGTKQVEILQKWREYAEALEKQRELMSKNLLTLDEDGYPKPPALGYDLKALAEALTAHLTLTWHKLHEGVKNIPDIQWAAINSDPTKYINVNTLPPLLLPFQIPTKFLPKQILCLQQFLEENYNRPYPERFPFIIQSEVEALDKNDSRIDSEAEVESPLPFSMDSLPGSTPPPLSSPSARSLDTALPHATPQHFHSTHTPHKNTRPRDDNDDTAELCRAAKIRKGNALNAYDSNVNATQET